MSMQHPISYDLGQHTLEVAEEAVITIGDETLAVRLDQEETYRLHLVLADLFQYRSGCPIPMKVFYTPD